MNRTRVKTIFAALALGGLGMSLHAENSRMLWQIGRTDTNNTEFALAPGSYAQFQNDPCFIIGSSDPKRDWPYIHPGPMDDWAGGREHPFTILFGLEEADANGSCRLVLDVLDAHQTYPPRVRFEVNGHPMERRLIRGNGDSSVRGEPARGKPQRHVIEFPAAFLRAGVNHIDITIAGGSWFLYDSIGLEAPPGVKPGLSGPAVALHSLQAMAGVVEREGKLFQPVEAKVVYLGEPQEADLNLNGETVGHVKLTNGVQRIEILAPEASRETSAALTVWGERKTSDSQPVTLIPVRKMTVYILPHSHTDIGYTDIQTDIEKKQVQNLLDGIAGARRTANYPEGARFVWNVEVLWAADLYLNRLGEAQRADFLAAVQSGRVALNGMYLNELTGLCRPEELLNLFRFSTILAEKTGVKIDSAMISDVPGYTWGSVTAMNQAGIKYFSTAPNYFDRIGTILREWENKPFWWRGPDGESRVLVWIPFRGYAMSHGYREMSPRMVLDLSAGLEKANYPYDIAYMRWSGHGDNAVPEPEISDFVRDWNARFAWPRFVISGTSEAFRAFEQRYGDRLPVVRGDWTPYWEDGAGSSALETALNRATSDRLSQAEALFAMSSPDAYPAAKFQEAWNNVLLYSEHTWGADCSISAPEKRKTIEQWEIKRSYAEQASRQSHELLDLALHGDAQTAGGAAAINAVDVINTTSWPRTDLVVFPGSHAIVGDRVTDDRGQPVPSQRFSNGDLVFLPGEMPPYSVRRYALSTGAPHVGSRVTALGNTLDNGLIRAVVDETTGGITELTARDMDGNFADTSGGEALNDYRYFIGSDPAKAERNGPVKITVGERGPLVASLVIESAAPGCHRLTRELRLVAGRDCLEVFNLVDKAKHVAENYKQPEGKESLNFAFPFNVPDGEMLLDIPLGVMRPEADQMPSACKNWFTVGRWSDVSNVKRGITWVTLDAPLVQVGGLTANLLESQSDPEVWRKKVDRTQKLYSWAMNNHWGTNYRATQEGPTRFRFILRPHRGAAPDDTSRFATGFSQPLLVRTANGKTPPGTPLLKVNAGGVHVVALKPSDDGNAIIARLLGTSGKTETAQLEWAKTPKSVWISDTGEKPLAPAGSSIKVPAWGVVTLRAEM